MSKHGSLAKKLAFLTVAGTMGFMTLAVGPAVAAAPTTTRWILGALPAGDNAVLNAVSCPSGRACIAVGGPAPGYGFKPVVYGRDGTRWTSLPGPADARGSFMAAIACLSTTYCVAVGGNGREHAQAWSWNGVSWSDQSTYNPTTEPFALLSSVECAGPEECEAVGVKVGEADADYPLAERWNGERWTNQPIAGPTNGWLNSVSCESASKCEAVGYTVLRDGSEVTLAMGLHDSTWKTQAMPALPARGYGYDLTGVSCYSDGCTAVGYSESGQVLAEVWKGEKWALLSQVGSGGPPGSQDAEWNAVECRSAISCTAVGAWDDGTRPFLTLADNWNGRAWTKSPTPSPSPHGDELYGLSCVPGRSVCTAVGSVETDSTESRYASLVMSN